MKFKPERYHGHVPVLPNCLCSNEQSVVQLVSAAVLLVEVRSTGPNRARCIQNTPGTKSTLENREKYASCFASHISLTLHDFTF